MRQYEHWANMLYPKMTFSDVTERIEALAKKREFKVSLYYIILSTIVFKLSEVDLRLHTMLYINVHVKNVLIHSIFPIRHNLFE